MPDEGQKPESTEPFLEVGTPESGSGTASLVFILTIIFTVLVAGFLVFYKFYTDSQAKDRLQTLENLQTEIYSKKNQEVEVKAKEVNSSITIISAATRSKYLFKSFIDELTQKITNDTKLNNLTINDSGKVTMDGESASYRSVADLSVALQSSSKIKNVEITGLSQSAAEGETIVSFSITAEIADWNGTTSESETSSETGGGE